jgi:hypothetical protein
MKRTIKITESQMKKIIDRISEGEYHIDEEEQMTVYNDASKLQSDLETDTVKRGQTVGVKDDKNVVRTITVNEEMPDEDIFLEEEEIDPSKGIAGLPMA